VEAREHHNDAGQTTYGRDSELRQQGYTRWADSITTNALIIGPAIRCRKVLGG